ncbi:penicillin-binding transpeptidase domain-containing protein [Methylopila sp. 73B]|uniref:penicillin-binding transpeptidase domain-containing protein n=1 Tax=Methylopila sp. 73B TaxID=1120792 RepID=UPI00035FE7FA|nr:penicillin-binding transpeptidase domain-containing protein [Methylopila sp. 73B]
MAYRSTLIIAFALASAPLAGRAQEAPQGPASDFAAAYARAFAGVDACVTLRDVAPGAEPRTSDAKACADRLPPCATFDVPVTVIALDRGLAPDANTPIRREDMPPEQGVTLKDAFRTPTPWVYEEIARRIGPDAFGKSLSALRYGAPDVAAPVERMALGESPGGPRISAVEQVDFLARLKRGELPTSAESQARTVEVIPFDSIPDGLVAWKTGACGPADGAKTAWAVGWVDRGRRTTVFAAVERGGDDATGADAKRRMRALLEDLALTPRTQ